MANLSICTSWDDGAPEDERLVELLSRYNIPAMLFIPASNGESAVIGSSQIRSLSAVAEIGSHTYHHLRLNTMSLDDALREAREGRAYLEDVLGREVPHFCFPGGTYTGGLMRSLPEHFASARTAVIMSLQERPASFRVDPTINLRRRSFASLAKHTFLRAPMRLRPALLQAAREGGQWRTLVQLFLEYGLGHSKNRRVLHLWGHSWEIKREGAWKELDDLFRLLSDYSELFTDYSATFGI